MNHLIKLLFLSVLIFTQCKNDKQSLISKSEQYIRDSIVAYSNDPLSYQSVETKIIDTSFLPFIDIASDSLYNRQVYLINDLSQNSSDTNYKKAFNYARQEMIEGSAKYGGTYYS